MSHDAAEHGIEVTGDIDWDDELPKPSTPVHDPVEDIEECGDRGPRIGETSVWCYRAMGHEGWHQGDPTKGWGDITW